MRVTDTPQWAALEARANAEAGLKIAELFAGEPDRLDRMCVEAAGLVVDLAKQPVSRETLGALTALAEARGVREAQRALAAGEIVNLTEGRPALHMALRGTGGDAATQAFVAAARAKSRAFAEAVRSGARTGATGRRLTHLVHIGIGGSGLGPMLVAEALHRRADPACTLRFAANVDAAEINDAMEGLDPEATLVFVVSKSFTTQETRLNAETARAWLAATLGERAGEHIVAITAAPDKARAFGVAEDAIFEFRDWVGGRYSLWSSVSLALEIALGPDAFDALLAGAAEMDAHALEAPLAQNAPALMALAEIWNRDFLGRPVRAVIPYARRLRSLPSYLQQLEMESNGKGVDVRGAPVCAPTQPVVFGAPGTDAQHAFFQQLHQGPNVAPVDFIGVLADAEARPEHHRATLANLFAQAEALMAGEGEGAARRRLTDALGAEEAARLAPHRTFPGDRPSTTILLERLEPQALGALIALYEHKVFIESVIWGINAFDQWGVELGKTLAAGVLGELEGGAPMARDASTAALIARARRHLQ